MRARSPRQGHHRVGMIGAFALTSVVAANTGTVAASPARAGRATPRVGVAPCAAAALVVWLDTNGNGAAGSTYYNLEFTNLSGVTCTLAGYPGVSGVSLAGVQLGVAATETVAGARRVVTLKPLAQATATLRITEALNYPSSTCRAVEAAGLRVYAPNTSSSSVVPYPFLTCSRAADHVLAISPVEPS